MSIEKRHSWAVFCKRQRINLYYMLSDSSNKLPLYIVSMPLVANSEGSWARRVLGSPVFTICLWHYELRQASSFFDAETQFHSPCVFERGYSISTLYLFLLMVLQTVSAQCALSQFETGKLRSKQHTTMQRMIDALKNLLCVRNTNDLDACTVVQTRNNKRGNQLVQIAHSIFHNESHRRLSVGFRCGTQQLTSNWGRRWHAHFL